MNSTPFHVTTYVFYVKIHGHRGPKGRAQALGPKGLGPALGPPVAMYFHINK